MTQDDRDAAREFGRLVSRVLPEAEVGWGLGGVVVFEVVAADRHVKGSFDPRNRCLSYAGETDDGREGIYADGLAPPEFMDGQSVEAFAGPLESIAQWLS